MKTDNLCLTFNINTMKIKVFCLLLTAILFLNSCMSLLEIGRGTVKDEVSISSYHSEDKKKAVELVYLPSAYSENFLTVYLWNNTSERIYIEWENARCEYGKVIFGDDRRITMNNAKADEAISPHSQSLKRDVTSMDKVGSDYISPLFRTSNLKQGIDENINLKIPVRFADGKVEEYCFNIRLYWQAETPK